MNLNQLHLMLLLALPAASQQIYSFSDNGKPHRYQAAPAPAKDAKAAQHAPVFYDTQALPTPERLAALSAGARAARLKSAERVMTAKLLVKINAKSLAALEGAAQPINSQSSLLDGWMTLTYADPHAALNAVAALQKDGFELTPIFIRNFTKRQTRGSDPLFQNQWHLLDPVLGTLGNAWDMATGKEIVITIVDDGLDIDHEDLAPNSFPLDSGYHRNFQDGAPSDPRPAKAKDNHGTNCGGVAAARGFNDKGVAGVAPEAKLIGLRLLGDAQDDEKSGTALAWQPEGITVHVSSNSWGATDDAKDPGRNGPLHRAGMEKGATEGRGGLGVIYCVSGGNGRAAGDDSGYDEFASSRFAIGVGAVNRKGEVSSFSEDGMNIAISALGGEFTPPEVVWTTNNSGDEAFAIKAEAFPTSTAPVHYTDAFNGTSAAAPQVSGAAALLLERNPRLGYRDVKEILIRTAKRAGLNGSDAFVTNGAGLQFSHTFGAGLLNIPPALEMAQSWTNLGPLQMVEVNVPAELAIGNAPEAATFRFDFSTVANLRVEHVEFTVNVKHAARGEVGFILTAPSGMKSVAEPRAADDNADFENYTFTSTRHWGEASTGVWTLQVTDAKANDVNGTAANITMRIYGSAR